MSGIKTATCAHFRTEVALVEDYDSQLTPTVSNYGANDLLRYQNNINVAIKRHDRKMIVATPMESTGHNVFGHRLEAIIGRDVQQETPELNRALNVASDVARRHEGYWILLDTTRSIYYKETLMKTEWIQSVVPEILEGRQLFDDGYVHVELNTSNDVLDAFDNESILDEMYIGMLEKLLDLYGRGTIAHVNPAFMYSWNLEKDVEHKNLYHPIWSNSLLTDGDHTKYLMNIYKRDPSGEKSSYDSAFKSYYLNFLRS